MNNDVWRPRDADLVAKYAERLYPADDAETEADGTVKPEPIKVKISANGAEEIEFRYVNGPPPKDLLNYKNMDLEMSMWARTGSGWMSVWVLIGIIGICFAASYIVWILRFTFF